MSESLKRKHRDLEIPSAQEDEAITSAARADPHARPLTRKQLREMVPMRALRGRPKAARTKQLVSMRYSPEVLDYFRSTGAGWQSRIDRVLRDYVQRHSRER